MRFKNREEVFKQAKALHPSLGTLAQNDVELSDQDIQDEVSRCVAQTDAVLDYISLLTSIDSYELPDSKDTPNESL